MPHQQHYSNWLIHLQIFSYKITFVQNLNDLRSFDREGKTYPASFIFSGSYDTAFLTNLLEALMNHFLLKMVGLYEYEKLKAIAKALSTSSLVTSSKDALLNTDYQRFWIRIRAIFQIQMIIQKTLPDFKA